ncbi:MAG TPA: peptide MFS transporter [Kofleriaceae bacterium]|nr:peptide MFS transporter [Kofleriaceae bacterium]
MSKDKDRAFFGHPAGLSTLFFTEMWERFSYYGMRALLIYYLTAKRELGGIGLTTEDAGFVWGLFVAWAYLLSLPGGWIADRFLGQRKAITVGGLGILAGNALLAVPSPRFFYPGLVLIALGTGLFKPNVSTVVGQLYGKNDARRDSGYTIFYMGINVGAIASPLVCGYLAENPGFRHFMVGLGVDPNWMWHIAFLAVALGMALGLTQYLLSANRIGEAGMHPTVPADPAKAARDRTLIKVIGGGLVALVIAFVAAMYAGLSLEAAVNGFGVALLIAAVVLFIGLYRGAHDHDERKRVIAMIPLFVGCVAFFGIFEQAGTTLSLFAASGVHEHYLGINFLPEYYQDVNPVFILLLAPVFAWLWVRLVKANKEPSSVVKFGIGMILVAVSFLVMLPALGGINAGQRVSPNFLIALYFFSTCAELCISPVGLSTMNKLAPERLAGMVMGTWFLGISAGEYIAGRSAGFSQSHGYAVLFYTLIVASLVVAVGLLAVAPTIRRMTAGNAPLPKATALETPPAA